MNNNLIHLGNRLKAAILERSRPSISIMLVTMLLTGLGSLSLSQVVKADNANLVQQAKLTASDAAAGDEFGDSVAIDGDTMVVGAPQDSDAGDKSGSAYVFVRSGNSWSQQAKLTAGDAAADDEFGISVAISGDTVVIGAPQDADAGHDSGAAYVFVRSGADWSEQDKLTASDASNWVRFGSSVAISGDTVVVGAYGDDNAGYNSGAAYVFVRSDSVWSQQKKLTASDAAEGDNFGVSVDISTDTVVVGASGDDNDTVTDSGSAYVFLRSGSSWSQQKKLTASDAEADDLFGVSVAISDDTVVVGAHNNDDAGNNSGSAYVFMRSGSVWNQQAKLTASDAAADDRFGNSVAVSGDTVVSGAAHDNDGTDNSGSAYVFVRSGNSWSQQTRLTASDAAADDMFGNSVAISYDTIGVGAASDDNDTVTDSGSAYVYSSDTDPTADFSAASPSKDQPLIVNFTDTTVSSDGITSWEWDFGDGQTSTEQSPVHEYAQHGTYTVSLTVTEADGDSNTKTDDIVLNEPSAGGTSLWVWLGPVIGVLGVLAIIGVIVIMRRRPAGEST